MLDSEGTPTPAPKPAAPPDPRLQALHHLLTAALALRNAGLLIEPMDGTPETIIALAEVRDATTIVMQALELVQRELSNASIEALNLPRVLRVTA